jgi:hypothetical protein
MTPHPRSPRLLVAAGLLVALVAAGIAYGAIPQGHSETPSLAAAVAPSKLRVYTASFGVKANCAPLATVPGGTSFVITGVTFQGPAGGPGARLFTDESCSTQFMPSACCATKWTFNPGVAIAPGATISVSTGGTDGSLQIWVYGYLATG